MQPKSTIPAADKDATVADSLVGVRKVKRSHRLKMTLHQLTKRSHLQTIQLHRLTMGNSESESSITCPKQTNDESTLPESDRLHQLLRLTLAVIVTCGWLQRGETVVIGFREVRSLLPLEKYEKRNYVAISQGFSASFPYKASQFLGGVH
ncbi:hypothetical protein NIES22_25830 [Calothrix brevissima NIES-22]|nr:hypothetical protein NIES22_25830 [Calothrix brevissima NIES-22]